MSPEEKLLEKAFHINEAEAKELREAARALSPSPHLDSPTTFEGFVADLKEVKHPQPPPDPRQVPAIISDLARRALRLKLTEKQIEGIRKSMFDADGLLRWIIDEKGKDDDSHPPYVRVACTGKGDYDDRARARLSLSPGSLEQEHAGDFGSPVVLELWPGGHYSTIHQHGTTTGILLGLVGELTVLCYEKLDWDAKKLGLTTLTPGQVCWLDKEHFPVHKVACLKTESRAFGASFHVYLNNDELPRAAKDDTRDKFEFVEETPDELGRHKLSKFVTYSDLSWSILKHVIDR